MNIHARRTLCLAALATASAFLSGCSTTYNSAGESYMSVWPFIGSRNPDLQLNFPPQNVKSLQLGRDPDPLYFMYPQPPIDPRVTSPYSLAPADPEARLATVGDNEGCADRCESKENGETGAETGAPLALRVDAGDGRRIASR